MAGLAGLTNRTIPPLGLLAALLLPATSGAQNVEIIEQDLDEDGYGYTVMRVWGSHYEMGFGMGAALGPEIVAAGAEAKDYLGAYYELLRGVMEDTTWLPAEIDDELEGMLDGIRSVEPDADLDLMDLKLLNTFGDWGYYGGCRSHSCWGRYVSDPARTLSTRRLDFSAPFELANHHVLCAWDPDDGSPRWVNMAWPGYVAVVTGVNEYGTLASLHDYGTTFTAVDGGVPRCVACRHVLTGMDESPVEDHLAWAEAELAGLTMTTGTFINYYAPEGAGGVFTCTTGGSCTAARVPQSDYFSGEVLITANSATDGHSVPSGAEFLDEYYAEGYPKALDDHFDVMGRGMHLMTVEFRDRGDMTIWAEGDVGSDYTDRIELEWDELFPIQASDDDDGADDDDDGGDGCNCSSAGVSHTSMCLLISLAALGTVRRRHG